MSATNRGAEYRPGASYYTPDDLARALVGRLHIPSGMVVLEPHVGGGAFVRALRACDTMSIVQAMDIDPDAPGLAEVKGAVVGDFLTTEPALRPDWIIGNPPYGPGPGVAEAHIRRALQVVHPGGSVAFLLRLAILESAARVPLWREHPPRKVWALAERPSFTGGGTDSAAYGWVWWDTPYSGPTELEVLSWR